MGITKFRVIKEYNGIGSSTSFEPTDHYTFLGAVIDIVKHYFQQKKTNVNVMNQFTIKIIKLG